MHNRQMPQRKKISAAFVSNIRIESSELRTPSIRMTGINRQSWLTTADQYKVTRIFCLINSEVRVLYFNVFQT